MTQTSTPTSSNKALRVVVARKYGQKDEAGHQKSLTTRVGRAYPHSKGQGLNVIIDSTPVLTGNARLVVFAGEKGAKFEGAAAQLAAFDVVEYQDRSGATKKQWSRIGTAFLSVNAGAYDLVLDALPTTGKVTCIVPRPRTEGEASPEAAEMQPEMDADTAPF